MSSRDDNFKIILNNSKIDRIKSYTNRDGKISCKDAFKCAKKEGFRPQDMSGITKSLGIRITDCELGVFGKLHFDPMEKALYDGLQMKFCETHHLDCKTYWEEARASSLHRIGEVIQQSEYEVVNCQLGCFRFKKGKKIGVKSGS